MFTVYSKPDCHYCVKAKALLESANMPYAERVLDIGQDKDPSTKYFSVDELRAKAPVPVRSVPQIFINDSEYVGGFEALKQHLARVAA